MSPVDSTTGAKVTTQFGDLAVSSVTQMGHERVDAVVVIQRCHRGSMARKKFGTMLLSMAESKTYILPTSTLPPLRRPQRTTEVTLGTGRLLG
eukprot:COSAG01_NODE_7091_length_3358_cov_5.097269_2_plen_93_part_00